MLSARHAGVEAGRPAQLHKLKRVLELAKHLVALLSW